MISVIKRLNTSTAYRLCSISYKSFTRRISFTILKSQHVLHKFRNNSNIEWLLEKYHYIVRIPILLPTLLSTHPKSFSANDINKIPIIKENFHQGRWIPHSTPTIHEISAGLIENFRLHPAKTVTMLALS
jgi:hypothetical protein